MPSKATELRYRAMREMSDKVMRKYEAPGSSNLLEDTEKNRKEIAEMIRPLANLGRTERWQKAITAWASAVENPEYKLQWAFLQYSVYAGYAAE